MRIETNNINYYNSNAQVNTTIKKPAAVKEILKQSIGENKDGEIVNEKNERKVIEAIEKANKHFKVYDRKLEFSIHEKTKQIVVKVINTEDDSVVREIPSEKILDMVAKLCELAGIFVDEKR